MDHLFTIDWHSAFYPDTPFLEIFIRGTIVYLGLLTFLRLSRREAGGLGMSDVLFIVLIADASQNAMASDYKSVTDGIFLVGTLVFWNVLLDMLGYFFPSIERLLHPAPVSLVKNGQINRNNMRRQLITKEELMTQLREKGIEDIQQVKTACLEGDGKISVVQITPEQH